MRRIKLAVLHAAHALGLFWLSRRLTASGIRVLCYHGIWMGGGGFRGDSMFMSEAKFRRRLETIKRLGYPVIPLSEAVEALNRRTTAPDAAVVITIDDGWYSTYACMLPALVAAKTPATLYCDTGHLRWGQAVPHIMAKYVWTIAGPAPDGSPAKAAYDKASDLETPLEARLGAAQELARCLKFDVLEFERTRAVHYMSKEELRDLFQQGIDVQLHTDNHSLHDMSLEAVEAEIVANRAALAQLLGVPSEHFNQFCYPSGMTSPSAVAALDHLGIASSATLLPGLTYAGEPKQLIRRFGDGEQVTDIEFEAELSGFTHLIHTGLAAIMSPWSALRYGREHPLAWQARYLPPPPRSKRLDDERDEQLPLRSR